ncbi:MAG TPA: glycosyltransferase [Solirubrobacteraceae bacterium]|nr:glycosyltransferase [Solirubrobacteraceae bacterium]
MGGPNRVLFTTTPGWGHVNPLVPLAHAFVQRGDEVLWATAGTLAPALERAGFQAVSAGIALGGGSGAPPFDPSELATLPARDRSTFIFTSVFAGVLVPPMLADLGPIIERFRPSVVIHEAAEFAAAIAAATAGIPSVTHALGRIMPREHMAAIGEQVAGLWEEFGLQAPPYAGSYAHLYLDICPPSLQSAEMEHVPSVAALRPIAYASDGEEGLPSWPEPHSSNPLVYVTFGTTFASRMAPTATVLRALGELPVRVVATVGPDGDPELLGEQPPNVRVARYIPQTQLLDSCAAVVSHAGSGTLFAALARGLPQLCLPLAADQFQNAEACASAGAGIALAAQEVNERSVRAAVERLLADPAPKAAAQRIAGEIALMPGPDEVAQSIAERYPA